MYSISFHKLLLREKVTKYLRVSITLSTLTNTETTQEQRPLKDKSVNFFG